MAITLIEELLPGKPIWDLKNKQLPPSPSSSNGRPKIKSLSVKKNSLSSPSSDPTFRLDFQYIDLPLNRVLTPRESHLYLQLFIAELRFPNIAPKETSDYLLKVLAGGIELAGRTYRFFGNSNLSSTFRASFRCDIWDTRYGKAQLCMIISFQLTLAPFTAPPGSRLRL